MPGKLIKPTRRPDGYWHLTLSLNGKLQTMYLHRIVLEAFVGARPDGMEALHRDDNQNNNCVSNLRWGTHGENCIDRSAHGGSGHKLTYELAQEIRGLRGKMRFVDIGERYGITKAMVWKIMSGRYWNTPLKEAV